MTDSADPLAKLNLVQAIDLRWTLSDIRGKRWKMFPIDPSHLKTLIEMGLVEMRNVDPYLTNAGLDIIV
jgi:hypothetical protein